MTTPTPTKHYTCATSAIEAELKDIRYRLDRVRMYGDAAPSREEWIAYLTSLSKLLTYLNGEFGDMLLAHGDDLAEREAEYEKALEAAHRRSEHGGPPT